MCPETYGKQGETRAVGDKVTWDFNVDVGQMANAVQVGMGTASDGTGFHWESAGHQWATGVDNNQRYKATFSNFQFTEAGQYNVIYQAKANSGDTWTTKSGNGWGNPTAYPPADFGATYFTVAAIPNPTWTSQTAVEGGIQLNWEKATTLHDSSAKYDVMVVRYSSSATSPAVPENNRSTAYVAGNTIGSAGVNQGTVVYIGGDTSKKDTGASNCNSYKYVLYSENYKYFSSGLSPVTVAARCAPAFGSAGTSTSTTVGSPIAEITVPSAGGNPAATYSISPNDVTGASFNANTRKFNFTPTATGTYTFTVTASNVVGTATFTITVTVNPTVPSVTGGYRNVGVTNAEFSLQVTGLGGAESLTANGAGVVYSVKSVNGTPTVGGTGCTSIPFTDNSGTPALNTTYWVTNSAKLLPGTTYAFRAYAANSAGTGYSTSTGEFTTECFEAPDVDPTGAPTSATFTWGDVGAETYVLRVWKDFEGGSGGGTVTNTETFNNSTLSGTSYTGNKTITGGDLGTWTSTGARGDLSLDGDSNNGKAPTINFQKTLTSPALSNAFTNVTFRYSWPYSESSSWNIDLYVNTTKAGSYQVTAGTAGTAIFTNLTGAAGDTITISNATAATSNKRILIDNINFIGPGGSGGSTTNYTTGGASGQTATSGVSVSLPVTGWTYNWSLTASGGGCSGQTVTGTVVASSSGVDPAFAESEVSGTATVGDALLGTYTHTQTVSAGYPAPTYGATCASGGATAGTGTASGTFHIDDETGAFTFTPAKAGTYVFTVTAVNNYGGSDHSASYQITVLARMVLDVGTSGTGTLSGGGSGATYVVARNGTGTFDTPPTGSGPNQGGSLGSGANAAAVVYRGTALTFADATAVGCAPYYYKAWVKESGGTAWTESAVVGPVTMVSPGTPVVTMTNRLDNSFEIGWTPGPGPAPTNYLLTVTTAGSGGSGGGIAGTYTKITSMGDLTEGNYLVVGASSSSLVAMSNTLWSSPAIHVADVADTTSATSLEISADDAAIVWHFAYDTDTDTWSFKNEAYNSNAGGYAASAGNGGNYSTINNSLDDAGRWKIGRSGDNWAVTNLALTNRVLRYNSSQPRFACYTSGQNPVMFYKQTGGGTATVLAETVLGNVTNYTVSGLSSGTDYEYSLKAEGYGENCQSEPATGTVQTTASTVVPGFTEDEVAGTATVGDATHGTYTLTKTPDTGWPAEYTYSADTVSGTGLTVAGEGTYGVVESGANAGRFTFTPTAGGTYKFRVTAENTTGTGYYTVTVTVTPRKPSIGALTPGEGTLGGTVSGLGSGATVLLRRYADDDDADDDTDGASVDGTTVVSGSLAGGTFTDNNGGSWLTGCVTYYYKVRQTENGQTSDWSDVVSGSPTVGAMGTVAVTNGATSLGFGWEAVPGAAGYKVQACLEGDGGEEEPEEYTGTGTFTEITSTNDFTDGGFYVLLNGTTGKALNGTVSSSTFGSTDVSSILSGGTLTDPTNEVVWYAIEYKDGSFGLQNVGSGKFATGSSGTGVSALDEDDMTSYSYWWVSSDHGEPTSTNGVWRFKNDGAPARALFPSGDSWKNYDFSNEGSSNYRRPRVYKLTGGGSSCVSATTTEIYHTLTGLESGETYTWTVTPYGASESCTGEEQTGTASTTGTPAAPTFSPASGEQNAVVGTELAVTLPAATGFPKAMTYTLTGPSGVSGWSFTATNRAFAFTPAAVGDHVFTLTAENTTGSGTYAFTVHAGAGVPTIAATSAVPSSASASLSATGVNMMGAASTSITLEYGLTTSYGSSATNVTPASLEADTVNGTLGATLYGLTTGTTYYYKWTVTSTGGVATATGSFETGCIDAPVVTAWHSGHNLKLSWEAVTGAESYKVEVSTDSSFAGAAGAETEVVSTPDDELDTGWSYVNGGDQAKDYHIMTNSSAGVVSPSFSTEPYSRMKVNYSLATYGGPGKNKLTCYYAISMDSGTTWGDWVEIDWDSSTASDNKTYHSSSMELPSEALGKANVKVKWEASTAASGVGLRFRGLSVTGTASGSTAGTTANPAVVTTNATTGKLEWQWEAEEDGNYYYRVTAYSAGCGEVPGSTGGPVDLSEGAVLSLGEATPVSIPWTLTPQAEWAGWVLVWNDDGDFGTPEDGVAPREAGDSFAGGTILQKGAGGSVDVTGTHTGLQACGRYYYKVFAYASGYVWDTTLHKEMGLTAAPLAPTGVAATGVGQRQFTVVWTPTADDGAVRYELTVAKGSMETNTTTALNSDFSSGVAVGWTNSGHTATYAGGTQLASGSNPGSVTSESLNLAGNDGEAKLTVNAMQYKSTESATLKVEVQAGSGSWMNEGELTLSSSAQNYPVTLTNCNTATKIRLSATGGHRVVLYSVKVTVDASSSDETTVLSAEDVTSGVSAGQGSWTVTGLDEYTEYHFGVRAAGVNCDGDWVTNTVTTLGGPMIETRPTRLSFGGTTPGVAVTKTLVVTNSGHGDLTVTGATFSGTLLGPDPVIKENDAAVAWSMTLAAGASRTLTVTWTPTTGGTLDGTLTLANDTEGLESLVVPLSGTCRDPMSEPPQLTGYEVRGPADRENTVWDDHVKKSPAAGHEVTVKVWLYHASGIATEGSDAPSFKIYDADETTLKASGSFTSIREVQRNRREEMECTAMLSGWIGDATPGEYRVMVTAKSLNGHSITDADTAMPVEGYYELDRFDRRDEEGHAGHGWTIKTVSDADEVVALKDGRLVINGSASGQPGVNGRGGVVRDMQGGGYATEWDVDQSQLTWAFNFAGGRQTAWSTFDGGNYAGAFVLGATSENLFGEGTTCAGYAVVMRNGKVQLARMSAGLSVDSSLTVLGDGYPVKDGRQAIGVKVVFVPASEHEGENGGTETVPARLMLYVKEWEGRGVEAITGDSVTGHSVAFETVELSSETDVALLAESLRYVGMAWNHGSSAGGATTYGAFDDVYVPHEEGQGVPMEFDVADEDIEGPVFSDFNARGAFTYTQIPDGGLSVTGLVSDASGVYGANNKWTLFSNDTQVATGFFTANPNGNGAATNVALSASIAKAYFTYPGTFTNYVLEVESTDYDTDWTEDATTATARYHFTVTDQVLTEPTSVTADADGAEMVVLRWNAGGNWVVIMEGESAIPEDWTPPQGTNLESGQVLDGPGEAKFRVVYVGNGTWVNMGGEGDDEDYRCSEATELTVAPGSTNYYRVYGTAMGYYGKGIAPTNYPVKTPKYEKGEIVDSFSYPDKVVPSSVTEDQWKWASDFSLDREATGAGWDGGWWFGDGQAEDENGRAWKIHDGGLIGGTTEFPAGTANKLFWNDVWELDQKEGKPKEEMWMKRKLASPMSGGKVFVAFQMNYQFDGADKYILVSLTGGAGYDEEIVSFGMTGHDYTGDGKRYASLTMPPEVTEDDEWYTCQVNGDYQGDRYQFHGNEELGVGQDYVIVGELDWTGATPAVRMWAFYNTQAIPQDYDSAGGNIVASLNCAGLAGKTVTGVKISMGSPAKDWLGQAYVDELRMGKTWDETLLFNKPVVYQYAYGVTNGVDQEGHTLYKISDGQLAGHDPLDMNFTLYHRSGIELAGVRVLDPFAGSSATDEEKTLAGWQALVGGTGSHWTNLWTASEVNLEHVNLASNYTVQVKMQATGGKTNLVTSAEEGGGATATDLFIGEYGEGEGNDKYIELYNGLEENIDLRNYYVARMSPGRTQTVAFASMTNYTTQGKFYKWARVTASADTNEYILPPHSTVVLLNFAGGSNQARMDEALDNIHCHWIRMTNDVLDAGGDVPILLFRKDVFEGTTGCDGVAGSAPANSPTNKPWLDACGYATASGVDERYIMSRKVESEVLPRSCPLLIEPAEWDYRRWSLKGSSDYPDYTDFLTTAGQYDRNIGLGGNMEFTVYDDDTEPPTIGSGSKIHLGSSELAAQPGTTETVLAGWTFYEDGNSSKLSTNAWGRSMLTNAAITVGPRYAAWLANQTDKSFLRLNGGTDVNKEFAGLTSLANAGRLVVQPNPDWLTAGTDHTWVRFRFGMVKAEDRMFSFADQTASTNSFSSATLEWSTTGRDADDEWTAIASWNPQEEVNTWTLRSFDLSEEASGIPSDVATLYLRVNLSGYSGRGSMWSMDNVQLTGYPAELRVSDKELHENGFAFDANVYDESGVDLSGMEVTIGTAKKSPDNRWQTGTGVETGSLARATFEAVSDKAAVTEWYTQSLAGLLHVGLTAKDLDNDRTVGGANVDQETAEGHFGILQVYDDDEDKPAVEMTGMRAVGGTNMVQWKFVQDGSLMPTAWDDALAVSRLGAKTDSSSEKNMHWLDASGAAGAPSAARGVRQSGWQHGTKFWYFTVTPEEDTQITSLQMFNHINSKYGPTHFTVTVLQGGSEVFGPTAATYFLGSSTATWEDNLGQLNTWIHKSLSMNWTLEKGKTYEFRIQGFGGNKRQGVGAYWGVYDLQLGGGNGETEGMTIKTDADLAAGGSDWLHGSVYDTYSGLDASAEKAPKFTLTGPEGNTLAADRPLTFATALTADGQKKSAEEGRFTGVVPGMGYTDRKLGMYGGWVSAWDADDDRTEDSLESHVGLALTVVDNDVVGPTAPANVTVNGTAVDPSTTPNRNNVTWTNTPEFLVEFDVAHDQAPTAAQLTGTTAADVAWREAHGVKDASKQAVVTGVGEYRASLSTDAAAMSNAPSFSVAVTNGALANYGFENQTPEGRGWTLTGTATPAVGGTSPVSGAAAAPDAPEGLYSLYVPSGTTGSQNVDPQWPQSQVIVFDNRSGAAPRIGGTLKYYLPASAANSGPTPRVRFDAYTDEAMTNKVATKYLTLREKSAAVETAGWRTLELDFDAAAVSGVTSFNGGALGNGTVNCIRIALYAGDAGAYFDDVRIGVKVGDGTKGTMRYEAPGPEAQGLAWKYLFAADADNDREGDRMLGEAAVFYTAYDVTPPTKVEMPQTGASTETVDDPTTQFDLSWSTENVGPDNKDSQNGQAAGLTSNDALSPWYSYKIYYGVRDAMADEVEAATRNLPLDEYLAAKYITSTSTDTNNYQNWRSVTADSTIEDPNVDDATTYAALGQLETFRIRLYDLDFDQDYMVVIVGVDKAGNEGPATTTSWATNNTIKFAITQGVMRAKSAIIDARPSAASAFGDDDKEAAALYWNAAASADGQIKRTYDLIAMDAGSFSESKNNTWNLIGDSVRTNWSFDTGALRRNGNYIRFYRAAYQDRWRPSYTNDGQVITQRPMVSEDVYAMTAVKLIEGQNYVSLHGYGYTNTIGGIFGTDPSIWPTSSTKGQCTKLEFFPSGFKGAAAGTNAISPSRTFYLSSEGKWRDFDNISVEVTDNIYPELFQNGVSITLPAGDNFPANKADFTVTNGDKTLKGLYWHPILRVPTNNLVNVGAASDDPIRIEVKGGSSRTGSTWNFLSLNLPVSASPYRLGLELGTPHGFSYTSESTSPGKLTSANDILYAYDPVNRRIRHETGMYLTRGGSYTNHYHWTEIDPTTHQPVEMSTNVVVTNAFIWRSIYDGRMIGTGETPFQPNDMLVIDSRGNLQDWVWEYYPSDFYDFPTRWSGW